MNKDLAGFENVLDCFSGEISMSKREKNKKIKNFSAKSAESVDSFFGAIKKVLENLFYVSETDAEISPFVGKPADSVSADVLVSQIQNIDSTAVKETSLDAFFNPLVEIQDWYGEEEKETARRFSELKDLLQKNLRDLKVFKVGQIEIDVYVVGLDERNILTCIATKAVQT